MNEGTTFIYNYSAKENREVEEIRKKYLPRTQSKLEELRRLDNKVQTSGVIESLCAGIGGALVFGLGMCLCMEVIGGGALYVVAGVILGIIGTVGMIAAYPVRRRMHQNAKEKLAPLILELTDEIAAKKD